jgi:hypothetical protein
MEGDNVFANYIADLGKYKENKKNVRKNIRKSNNSTAKKKKKAFTQNEAKYKNRFLLKEDIQMANMHLKKYLRSLIARKIQIKITVKHQLI